MSQRKHAEKKHSFAKGFFIIFLAIVISLGAIFMLLHNLSCAEKTVKSSLYPIKYSKYVNKASEYYGLDKALIYAVIRTESSFDPKAKSSVGAKGLMQIMPETFTWMQNLRNTKLSESKLYDPATNIDYGCYLLSYFNKHYGNIYTAVAAYNAGFKVGNWLKDSRYSDDGKTLKKIPYDETSKYVKKIKSAEKEYNKLYFSKS